MNLNELTSLFEKHSDEEYIQFSRVVNPKSQRKDLHGFLLLAQLCPGTFDMVAAAEHDEITLDPSLEDLAASGITEEQVIELLRCGVRYDSDIDCLRMFV